ncbi:MAG: CinA family protein [Phocaeicola sp.]
MSAEGDFLGREVATILGESGLTLATAESCTGGMLSSSITAISGSSAYFKGGVIAYSNEIKIKVLGVSSDTLDRRGAVSEAVAIEMARGVMDLLETDCAIATTGIAGPTGGTAEKPVGTVWLAAVYKDHVMTKKLESDMGRFENMKNAALFALQLLVNLLQSEENEQ